MTKADRDMQYVLDYLKTVPSWVPYDTDNAATVNAVRRLQLRNQIEVSDLGFIKLKPKDITL